MLERLPTPWGLVRSGVAPDHPKIKSVTRVYEKTAAHPRFRFFGNVTFGEHVSREDLLAHYHAIVYATGSPLGPPARHPRRRPARLARGDRVRRLVQRPPRPHRPRGRPALGRARGRDRQRQRRDRRRAHARARRPRSSRRPTPPTTRSRCSRAAACSEVVVVGRRGPAQAAFTNPELLELGELTDADVIVDADELERALAVHDEAAEQDATARRNVEILRELRRARAARPAASASCCASCSRRSRCSPASDGALGAVELVRNELVADDDGAPARAARPTSARRSPPGSCSARSATAASRCPACPSTSAAA